MRACAAEQHGSAPAPRLGWMRLARLPTRGEPVERGTAQVDLHYNGFCNSVLWQLFHYVPLNIDSKLSETRTLQFQWAAHQARHCGLAGLRKRALC